MIKTYYTTPESLNFGVKIDKPTILHAKYDPITTIITITMNTIKKKSEGPKSKKVVAPKATSVKKTKVPSKKAVARQSRKRG